jgi:hypothetical protein
MGNTPVKREKMTGSAGHAAVVTGATLSLTTNHRFLLFQCGDTGGHSDFEAYLGTILFERRMPNAVARYSFA